jgi:hypothetical protein
MPQEERPLFKFSGEDEPQVTTLDTTNISISKKADSPAHRMISTNSHP